MQHPAYFVSLHLHLVLEILENCLSLFGTDHNVNMDLVSFYWEFKSHWPFSLMLMKIWQSIFTKNLKVYALSWILLKELSVIIWLLFAFLICQTLIATIIYFLFCRFFFGKNKVMVIALGKGETDEYKDNLHKVVEILHTVPLHSW